MYYHYHPEYSEQIRQHTYTTGAGVGAAVEAGVVV